MNPIQIAIIAFVVIVILLTLGYYWYDDAKFKKKVEDNFNQATKDVLTDNNKATIFDSIDSNASNIPPIMQKDVAPKRSASVDPILDGAAPELDILEEVVLAPIPAPAPVIEVPEDSLEAFFVKLDKIDFNYANEVKDEYDLVVDIVFEEPKKLKILPEVTQFTHKSFEFYILEKDNVWQIYEKGKKYYAKAIKLVVQLVDKDGIISQAQIENIYNELYKFVINNDAHIRCSDYETAIRQIQEQIKLLGNIELVLELYLLTKERLSYAALGKFLNNNGFVDNQGVYDYVENNQSVFSISSENQAPLQLNGEYTTFAIVAKLHLHEKPLLVLDQIFDIGEKFMGEFESRILTTNKQVIGQREYDQLYTYVKNYADSAQKKQVRLGGVLIRRLL